MLIVAFMAMVISPASADAVIMRVVSLREAIDQHPYIFLARVEQVEPDRPGVVLVTKGEDALKGQTPVDRLAINLRGDAEAKKGNHTQVMLDRLRVGRQAVVFLLKAGQRYEAMAFLDGTWFSLQGTLEADGQAVRWAFLHCEPYLRRTYAGTTDGLRKVIQDYLVRKVEPPKPNIQEKPGFGPEAEKKSQLPPVPSSGITRRELYGVIPSAVLVAPLAVVAAIFPGLFARLAVGMKRWRAFLAIASLTSTISLIYYFTSSYLPDSQYVSPFAMSVYLLGLVGFGLLWAGKRYRRLAAEDDHITDTPRRAEIITLCVLTLLVALLAASSRLFGPWKTALEPPMREFTFIALGLAVATLYSGYRILTRAADRRPDGTDPPRKLSLSGESVALGTLFLCSLSTLLSTASPSRTLVVTSAVDTGEVQVRTIWLEGEQVISERLTVQGDHLYCGTVKTVGFRQRGQLLAVNRHTGKLLWSFDADQSLKPPFSGVGLGDGRLYFGEGLHSDSDCQCYCVDSQTGRLAWKQPFPTTSHTEGKPAIAGGRVYFPAGDDGLICLDAATGQRLWQLPGKSQQLHIDGAPAISDQLVFAGSGLYSATLLAVDVATGDIRWKVPAPYRSFAAPLVFGEHVIYGVGTGNMTSDTVDYTSDGCTIQEKAPAGAILCLEAQTGNILWRYDLDRSVHTPLAADESSVYATSRDGCVHCLNRRTGKPRWRTAIGGAITAGPALASSDGLTTAVYAVSREGNVACLNPLDGRAFWLKPLPDFTWTGVDTDGIVTTPIVVQDNPHKRTIYVGGMTLSANTRARQAAIFVFEEHRPE